MSPFSIAARLQRIEASPTLALAAKAKALQQAGKSVLDFTAGEPDFPTAAHVKDAAIASIQKNFTRYTPVAGIPELRAAIAKQLTAQQGLAYEASQVLVTCGAKHALYNALQAICDPGDEVIVGAPYWVSYPSMIELADGKTVLIEMTEADGFQPDPERLRRALSPKTKAIILNSPSNPTGMLISRERLAAIAAIARERGLIVISDEIYDQMVFPPARAWTILQVEPRLAAQTLVVNGVSKSYSMTGWRIGYVAGPKPLIEAMSALQSHSTSNPTSISQYAALAALTGDQSEVRRMAEEFQQRRDRLVAGLNAIPGLSCAVPQGAFYAWCNISRLQQPASVIASRWLEEQCIAVIPGEGFGSPHHVRFSYATSLDTIDEGLARLQRHASTPPSSPRRSASRGEAERSLGDW